MQKNYEGKYHQLEQNQFWFKAVRKLIWQFIENNHNHQMILDIGCSGGIFLDECKAKGKNNSYGIDISEVSIDICKQKGHTNVHVMKGEKTNFKDNMFDVIIASNVLEHIENDEQALDEWNRILKDQGLLIVIVPAFKFLWSYHDVANAHYKRYTKIKLSNKIRNKFYLEKISYWNFILFFPVLAIRLLHKIFTPKNFQSDDLKDFNTIINEILFRILIFENWLLKLVNLPVGISLIAVAKCKK